MLFWRPVFPSLQEKAAQHSLHLEGRHLIANILDNNQLFFYFEAQKPNVLVNRLFESEKNQTVDADVNSARYGQSLHCELQ